MNALSDDILVSRFTRRVEIAGSSFEAFGFLNSSDFDTWAGNVEVKVTVFNNSVSSIDIGTVIMGGIFVISAGDFTEQDFSIRRVSSNISADFNVAFSVDDGNNKSFDILLHNLTGTTVSAACDIEFKTTYGYHVYETVPIFA